MKPVFFLSIILSLAFAPAFAGELPIVSDSEAQEAPAIELSDFTGGVSNADVHESGGTVVIQMIQPAAQSSAAAATSARYAAPAASSAH